MLDKLQTFIIKYQFSFWFQNQMVSRICTRENYLIRCVLEHCGCSHCAKFFPERDGADSLIGQLSSMKFIKMNKKYIFYAIQSCGFSFLVRVTITVLGLLFNDFHNNNDIV